uniref:Uncharacterized protein n=1 Tax=Acrobeloides nanus TaxID=290746 RepID=A0A914CEB3_9BILA
MENIEMDLLNRDDDDKKIYKLVGKHGEGELITWMRYAMQTGDTSFVDEYIDTKVKEFMYNGGRGKLEAVAELVKIRNKERNERLNTFARKKGKGKVEPNILQDFDQENQQGDLTKVLKRLEGGTNKKGDSKYREIIWKLDERGAMGENLVGRCLMQGSPVHKALAMKLITCFPKLINDVMISEEYYGLSPLHQAIVNEDPHLVWFLLRKGAKMDQRCFGAFFCADDQKASRTDSLEHEYVEISFKTNYHGRMYFGEYPLAYAASINQYDCYKILRSNKADPNLKDTNGNTVLHMIVIHDRLEMLKLAYNTGAKLNIANMQNLTPLTLAAKMAKRRMFEEILQLECSVVWSYGDAISIAYPLAKIDTIDEETGTMHDDSALSLAVYGETEEHLELLEGLLEDILDAKWRSFGKRKWSMNVMAFSIYWLFICLSFMTRPFNETTNDIMNDQTIVLPYNTTFPNCSWRFIDALLYEEHHYHDIETCTIPEVGYDNEDRIVFLEKKGNECHLVRYFNYGYEGYIRLLCEPVVWLGALYQVVHEILKIYHMGRKKYFNIMKSFPEKILYEISLTLILIIPFIRGLCLATGELAGDFWLLLDNTLSILIVIFSTMHFLFFLRSIKFVGPFIVMLYSIIKVDVTRFFLIYAIFMLGFSQGLYIVFLKYYQDLLLQCNTTGIDFEKKECTDGTNISTPESYSMMKAREWNLMYNLVESIMWSFISTFSEGAKLQSVKLYSRMSTCRASITLVAGKIIFAIFLFMAFIVLFHLFIAMLERTYETIFEKQNKEYKRQWAQAILLLELALNPRDRLIALMKYSKPIGTNKKKRAFVVNRKHHNLTVTEKLIKEQEVIAQREAKRAFYKRRLKDITHSMSKYHHSDQEINNNNKHG